MSKLKENIKGWLQLVRFPNLFTIPGDIFVGYALSGLLTHYRPPFHILFALLSISISLYSAGLILNDLADEKEDRRLNRKRPLTTGSVNKKSAWLVALTLIIAPIIGSYFLYPNTFRVTSCLAVSIIAYNFIPRKIVLLSGGIMGSCRALNIILASTVFPKAFNSPTLIAAAVSFLYIISICLMAYKEAEEPPKGITKWSAFLFAICGTVYMFVHQRGYIPYVFLLWVVQIFTITQKITPDLKPSETGRCIGLLIRQLITLQCCFLIAADAPPAMLAITFSCYFMNLFFSRKFYAS